MFTGIIEALGKVVSLTKNGSNVRITIETPLVNELKVDQSISHNGVCLTVVNLDDQSYSVDAVEETLQKTNLGDLKPGDQINLERCLQVGQRLDGHFVQGHVDATAYCENIEALDGSWYFTFAYDPAFKKLVVDKGSISINGISLTLIKPTDTHFKVAIIPYTYEHTNFKWLKEGDSVNIEFDIFGKYVLRYLENKDS